MKHLRRFFEAEYSSKKGVDRDELREFCEMNLAYLLDDSNFRLDIEYFDDMIGQDIIVIKLFKMVELSPGERMTTDFEWGEVKDYVIPFIVQLNKNYTFNTKWYDDGGAITVHVSKEWRAYTYEKFMRIVDRYYEDDEEVRYVEIVLDNK